MKKVILLTVNYKGRPYEIVRELLPGEFTLRTMENLSHEEMLKQVRSVDYILASGNVKIDQEVLQNADRLKMVQRLGVGLDSLDLQALENKHIPVYVNRGVNSNSVAEHTLMLILACLRRLTLIDRNTKSGKWNKQEQGVTTRELRNQTVGIIGMGNIGKRTAALLKPFGCEILYYCPHRLERPEEKESGVEFCSLEELLHRCDVITLHCPLTSATDKLMNADRFSQMRDGVILVNTARGGLIDEKDLLTALNTGKVGFAGLDVFGEEPIQDYALVRHEHVIGTPHIAGNTYDSFSEMMKNAFHNISLFDQGRKEEIEKSRIL